MCLSDVFLPNKENLYFFSLKNDTHAHKIKRAILLDVPIMCVCVCVCVRVRVVRARLCEEQTARVVSFVNQTQVFRVSIGKKREQKASKSGTCARKNLGGGGGTRAKNERY